MIKLTLPFPPTTNHMWGQVGKRKFLKKETVDFRFKVQIAAVEADAKIHGRIGIFIALYAPTKRKYDIDNRLKSLLDALQNAGVFLDDEQVDCIWAVRRPPVKGGMCKVIIVPANKVIETINSADIHG